MQQSLPLAHARMPTHFGGREHVPIVKTVFDVRIAEEAKAAKVDRPTRQTLVERAPAVAAPVPKTEVKVSYLGVDIS